MVRAGVAVKLYDGVWFPDDTEGEKWKHSFRHVRSVEWAIAHCPQHRMAVQAGGNVGFWPRRLAEVFRRVATFEPDAISRECLMANVKASNLELYGQALGRTHGEWGLERRGIGSHTIRPGRGTWMAPLDAYPFEDLDYLQLDIEGYEYEALLGAERMISVWHPLIQVELRDYSRAYGAGDEAIVGFLMARGYVVACQQPGADVVFQWSPPS